MDREVLLRAARAYGTPVYVYDTDKITGNVQMLNDMFEVPIAIRYACKALANSAVLKHILSLGCGIDAVSIGELRIALSAGFRPKQIHFTPSGAHFDEYLAAIELGVDISVDNVQVLEVLGSKFPGISIFLRVNPDVRSGAHENVQVGANDSKFGLYPEEYQQCRELISRHGIKVKGVHVHTGSEIHSPEDMLKSWTRVVEIALQYPDHLEVLNLGGGFKPYYGDQDKLDELRALNSGLKELLASFVETTGSKPGIIIEPGKFLTANAGQLLVEVTWLKELQNRTYVYVNSGFNHLIRPMYYKTFHPIENISHPDGEVAQYSVVGYLCETDTFAPALSMPSARRGDILSIGRAGAYAMSMASNYNSRPRPAEVMWKDGELTLIRNREM